MKGCGGTEGVDGQETVSICPIRLDPLRITPEPPGGVRNDEEGFQVYLRDSMKASESRGQKHPDIPCRQHDLVFLERGRVADHVVEQVRALHPDGHLAPTSDRGVEGLGVADLRPQEHAAPTRWGGMRGT